MVSTNASAASALSSTATRAPGPMRFVDKVDVERMFLGKIKGVIVGDVGLAKIKPGASCLAAALNLDLFHNHGAHGGLLSEMGF